MLEIRAYINKTKSVGISDIYSITPYFSRESIIYCHHSLGSFTGGVWPRKGGRSLLGYAIPPPNVHSTDWRDMLSITESRDLAREHGSEVSLRKLSEPHTEVHPPLPPLFSLMRFSESDLSLNRAHWITETFTRRECAKFVPTTKYPEK
ncbi:hypothetical protein ANCCAN_11729 [Ancylostoma caninum]|uniref:Uncharacterized protein n=1 Tax=Ancylostoma caninum TaxID=29170 RepID=A0A368GD59_ANCCA|nr:hypothetical protein ANCCAN_11729 [Ancylostoma caninum]